MCSFISNREKNRDNARKSATNKVKDRQKKKKDILFLHNKLHEYFNLIEIK
jgi:hypothetical protein